jgi:hypothetical protein
MPPQLVPLPAQPGALPGQQPAAPSPFQALTAAPHVTEESAQEEHIRVAGFNLLEWLRCYAGMDTIHEDP